jgi:hypothetical protein
MQQVQDCATSCVQVAAMTDELEEACAMLVECIDLRKKWLFQVRHRLIDCVNVCA